MQTIDEKHVSSELFTHRKTFANIDPMEVVCIQYCSVFNS